MTQSKKPRYDLEERTFKFSKDIIGLVIGLPRNDITKPIIYQLTKSGTSVAANYCEANEASSKRDFKNKISICKKEAHETKYWLRLIKECFQDNEELNRIKQEAQELILIFSAIIRSCNRKSLKIEN